MRGKAGITITEDTSGPDRRVKLGELLPREHFVWDNNNKVGVRLEDLNGDRTTVYLFGEGGICSLPCELSVERVACSTTWKRV